jgi:hypothetical protein
LIHIVVTDKDELREGENEIQKGKRAILRGSFFVNFFDASSNHHHIIINNPAIIICQSYISQLGADSGYWVDVTCP